METVTAQQSDSKYKFSEPLKVVNIAVKSKESKKNYGHVYNFSWPIDVSFPLTSNFGTNTDSYTGFGKRFKRSQTEWECDTCLVRNKLEEEKCVACETSRKPMTLFNDASFGQQFKKSLNKWECDTCMVQNKLESTKCAACETPRKENNLRPFGSSTVETSDYMLFKQFRFGCAKSNADDGFRTLAAHQKASKWECSACMTQNDNSNNKCVCCEQQKPGCKGVESKGAPSPGAPKFTFGFVNALNATTENDLRKASANECTEVIKANVDSWECTTCKTSNKNEGIACLACQSKKPVPQFKFGFSNSNTTSSDANFSALAAKQKSSKWECSACMTQNDNNNNKCVCCEQKKPGSTEVESKETPSSGSTKFTFGFGNGVNAPTEDDLKKVSSNEKVTIILKNGSWECAICKTSNKNEADACLACQSKKSVPQFKFGLANSNITPGDVNFSALAAQQKISKWECSACMTQNDNNNNKCVCCEQKKPGSTEVESKETPSSGSTKFRFGFGNGVNAPTEDDLKKVSSNEKLTIILKNGSWECAICKTSNKNEADACLACQSEKSVLQFKFGLANSNITPGDVNFSALAAQQKISKWECSACMTQNDNNNNKCVCCEQKKPGSTEVESKETPSSGSTKFRFGFGNGVNAPTEDDLKKVSSNEKLTIILKNGSWECAICKTSNKNEADACLACQSEKSVLQFKFGLANSNITPGDVNFSALAAQQKISKWECSACMTQNDNNNNKCVCCEQKKPGSTEVESKETPSSGSTKFRFGFGNGVNAPTEDDLKKVSSNEKLTIILKNGSWECAICKTSNKNEADACLACQSEKSVLQFKFGLANSNITPGDVNFSALAAQQKISKWECSACMTQNDNNNNKCVCCEQKKPGSTEVESKETPSSGSTKFTFGFGNGVNSPTKSDLSKASSSQNAGNIKADAGFRTLAVQQKNSKWECSVCMTQNDKNKAICVCCEQPKLEPGDSQSKTHEFEYKYTATTNKFHFGFGAGAASEDELRKELVQKDTTANDSFKTLAAEQKLSKWECETCMTHNDNDLSKCVCCRQTTPTAKTESEKQLHRCHKL